MTNEKEFTARYEALLRQYRMDGQKIQAVRWFSAAPAIARTDIKNVKGTRGRAIVDNHDRFYLTGRVAGLQFQPDT